LREQNAAVRRAGTKLDQGQDHHSASHVDLMLVATTRHVRDWPRVLAASPDYLVKAGSPRIRGAQRRAARRYLNVDLLTEHKETLRQAA
jgi:hypothetical protein